MLNFNENRAYIENEFQNAKFDEATGLSENALWQYLQNVQQSQTDLPRPIVCANAYAYLLDNVQLEINEHTPFAVKFNIGVDYSDAAGEDIFQKALFLQQREKILKERFPEKYMHMRKANTSAGTWTDFWHTVPDWNTLLELGFAGILQKAEASKENLRSSGAYTESQIVFLDSVIICYKAILRLLQRMYTYSLNFNTPEFTRAIQNLTQAPPKTLYEVMLFSVLYLYFEETGSERARTLGDIDRLYLPYYERDLENGASREELDELFRYYFIHFTATKRFAQQPFTIGGSDKDGNDRCNWLTLRILEIYDALKIYDPKIHLRYHKNINRAVLEKTLSMIRKGHSSICIMNDDAVYAGYKRLGIPVEDAQNYVVLGCYEPIIMGLEHGEIGAAWLNMVKSVELALNGGVDPFTGYQSGIATKTDAESFEEFFDIFLQQVKCCIDFTLDFAQEQGKISTLINPSPIYSGSFPACLEKGLDIHEYALKYNNMGVKLFGLATVVDSLTAIKKFVFDRKEISLDQLRKALQADWVGYEELQAKILHDPDKYGNNRPLPDEIMVKFAQFLDREYCGKTLNRGSKLRLGWDSIDYCMYMGEYTCATPDGRKSGKSLSKNLCATDGKDRDGITAYLQSVLKLDAAAFVNAAPCDFILHPTVVKGEAGLKAFVTLVEVFFAQGGFAMQGNIFDNQMLKQAQKEPEKYATLQVRICGWNAYFVKLSKQMQDKFIAQTE